MDPQPNEGYFHWLVSLTGVPRSRDPHTAYWCLLHQLHTRPFRWSVRNDDNRGEDAKVLRVEYEDTFDIRDEDLWFDGNASILEVLIALSRRLEFDTDISSMKWFWKLLENLGMQHFNDYNYHRDVENVVDEMIDVLLDRTYDKSGMGGLFPLRDPHTDQRRNEIWYQRAAYLRESEYVDNLPN